MRDQGRDRLGDHADHPRPRRRRRPRRPRDGDVRRSPGRVRHRRRGLLPHAASRTRSGLLASIPRLDDAGDEKLVPIRGAPPSMIRLPAGCSFNPRCDFAQERCCVEEPPLRHVVGTEPPVGLPLRRGAGGGRRCGTDATGARRERRARSPRRRDRHDARRRAAVGARPRQGVPRPRRRVQPRRWPSCRRCPASRSTSRRARRSAWSASRAAASRRPAGWSCA